MDSANQLHSKHCKETANLIGITTDYVFPPENFYLKNQTESRFWITLRRGGWDCLRYNEISSAGKIARFRNLLEKPPQYSPQDPEDVENCNTYMDVDQLLNRVQALTPNQELAMRLKALQWAEDNSTGERALEMLHRACLRQKT